MEHTSSYCAKAVSKFKDSLLIFERFILGIANWQIKNENLNTNIVLLGSENDVTLVSNINF